MDNDRFLLRDFPPHVIPYPPLPPPPPLSFKHFPSLQLSFAIISFERKEISSRIILIFKKIFKKREEKLESNRKIFLCQRKIYLNSKRQEWKNRIYMEYWFRNLLRRMEKKKELICMQKKKIVCTRTHNLFSSKRITMQ